MKRSSRPVRAAVALATLPLLALAACSGDDSEAAETTTTTAPTAESTVDLDALAGRYAHYDVVAYEDDEMKTLIISYGFTDYEPVDGELITTDSFCFSEHRSDQPISVEMSDEATSAIVPESVAVTVTETDDVVRISRPFTPTGIGVRLEDPANDPLPTDPDDPRIADDDNDGKPGVTARIVVTPEITGEIYLARREIFAYEVERQDDGSFTGHVIDESEQLVVGASDPMFITDAQWVQHPDPALSPIILIPVDDSWDCERLKTERPTLFPPTPEVDW